MEKQYLKFQPKILNQILSTAETKNEHHLLGDAEIPALIEQRQNARQNRNFVLSDAIRDRLQAVGVSVIEQPNGQTRWYRI